ncbi:MAG: ABC transporter permease subunit [Pseudomonadota bacterium]
MQGRADMPELNASDFQPLTGERETQRIVRPSRSYWQDAWIRLRANRRAIVSLYLVIGLLLFTFLGPVLWNVDPASQDVDRISLPPGADRQAEVVAPYRPWQGDGIAPGHGVGDEGLGLAMPANTQTIRLLWEPIPGASGYRLYRNVFPPEQVGSPGLPVAEITREGQLYYEDRMDLQPRDYHYTLVGLDGNGEEVGSSDTFTVTAQRVITVEEVRARGLHDAPDSLSPGDAVRLSWHPLGTDYLGRDMLARLMAGAQVSLFIGILAPVLFVLFGVVYGAVSGFVGGRLDHLLMRIADFVIALPFLLFMILFQVVFGIGPGESGIMPMLVALVLLSWPATARLVRGQILQIREEAYVSAARLMGATRRYLIARHMIPNTLGVILVTLTFAVPTAIFTEAFLSFIGMGVAPPTASWGSMSNEGLKSMLTHPHELILPSVMISITVLAFNLLGDGLRDALDARMRTTE